MNRGIGEVINLQTDEGTKIEWKDVLLNIYPTSFSSENFHRFKKVLYLSRIIITILSGAIFIQLRGRNASNDMYNINIFRNQVLQLMIT